MKSTRFTDPRIVFILKQQEGSRTTKELALENGFSKANIYEEVANFGTTRECIGFIST